MSLDFPEPSLLYDSHRKEGASLLMHSMGVLVSAVALVWMSIESSGDGLKIGSRHLRSPSGLHRTRRVWEANHLWVF